MLRLNRSQRRLLSEKVPDVANLAAGTLIFGQFIGGQPFSASLALFGTAVWVLLTGFALVLASGGDT